MSVSTEGRRLAGKANWRKLKIKGATANLKLIAGELQDCMTAEQLRDFQRNMDRIDNLLCHINETKYQAEKYKLKQLTKAVDTITSLAEKVKALR